MYCVDLNLVGMEGKSKPNYHAARCKHNLDFWSYITYMLIEISADLGEVVLQQEQNRISKLLRIVDLCIPGSIAVEQAAG
jgi:hypothetical protein